MQDNKIVVLEETATAAYRVCPKCHGQGKLLKPPSRKARLRHKRRLEEISNGGGENGESNSTNDGVPPPPAPRPEACSVCQSTGILSGENDYNETLPHIAVVGGGIGGLALAIACRHRGIPHTVYERDAHFSQRRQGYGLTLQQASKALKQFGNVHEALKDDGITSTRHVVHTTDGTVVGEWGLRKWGRPSDKKDPKRQNVHIARQALRFRLLQAADPSRIRWGTRLVDFREIGNEKVELTLQSTDDKTEKATASLLVGADGIRSQVRQQLIGDSATPLRYLDCLVVLGICPLSALDAKSLSSTLLDGATVFQTADGSTRVYMMPYSKTEYMWQLSFPMPEEEAARLSALGSAALKEEALKRCKDWHCPIPGILETTPRDLVSGYPVYDRQLLQADQLRTSPVVALMGDACHPMSPFKGQGANQAMLDALSLANAIYCCCCVEQKDLAGALEQFEQEMLRRSAAKVQASAEAAKFLHSETAIREGNVTRGAAAANSIDIV